jgi:hypothetical protein
VDHLLGRDREPLERPVDGGDPSRAGERADVGHAVGVGPDVERVEERRHTLGRGAAGRACAIASIRSDRLRSGFSAIEAAEKYCASSTSPRAAAARSS